MSEINILSSDLANKIAAGEVIERPVSVVKELVENAIDAGANRIFVEVKNGGRDLIKVTDNGKGISKDDLPLTIIRHATSKISSKEDLFKISSLGFRGEALPSIASVSQMEISSCKKGSAYKMTLTGCQPESIEETALGQGTVISVSNLFHNIPARQKFLKGEAAEYTQILDYMKRITLSSPHISFSLSHNSKKSFETQGLKDNKLVATKHAFSKIYGPDILEHILKIELTTKDMSVWGIITRPTKTRSDRKALNTFVNGRAISSPIISKAISEALRDIIPGNKFPYLALFFEINPEDVDVNVHPTKKEVRFAKGQEIFSLTKSAIRNSFLASEIAQMKEQTTFTKEQSQVSPSFSLKKDSSPIEYKYQETSFENTLQVENNYHNNEEVLKTIQENASFSHEPLTPTNNLVVLGQANRSWIIVLDGEDLLLIDQHAAHERINYEALKQNREKNHLSQGLLIPLNIELSSQQQATLAEYQDILKEIGFEAEIFSDTSIVLRSVPQNLKKDINYTQAFLELLDEIEETGQGLSTEKITEEILKMTACKASIKAGETLTYMEMKQLVNDLYATDNYLSCPHGRPLVTTITDLEIRKRFAR